MHRTIVSAVIGLLAALTLVITPAMAGPVDKEFTQIYDGANQAYTSLQFIAAAHNKFAASHPSNCSKAQSHKWWESKYRKDVTTVRNGSNRLKSMSSKVKKESGRGYSDFVKGFTDLVQWMNGKFAPRLLTCQHMPTSNGKVGADLNQMNNDLGTITY